MWTPITYKGFCALGALTNPRCMTRQLCDGRGTYLYTEYYYRTGE